MKNRNRNQRSAGERGRKKQAARIALFLCLSMLIQLSPVFQFGLAGTARAEEEPQEERRVLHCTTKPETGEGYADFFVHTHNDDCFNKAGELVCKLKEIKAHEHDESCFDAEGKLTCDKDEIILHTHDESCFDKDGKLICGKLEIREHVHDETCFGEGGEETENAEAAESGTMSEGESAGPQLITFPGDNGEEEENHHPQIFFFTGEDEEEQDEEPAEEGPVFITLFPEEESENEAADGEAESAEESAEAGTSDVITTEEEAGAENEESAAESTKEERAESAVESNEAEGEESATQNEESGSESEEPVFYFLFPEEETESEEGEAQPVVGEVGENGASAETEPEAEAEGENDSDEANAQAAIDPEEAFEETEAGQQEESTETENTEETGEKPEENAEAENVDEAEKTVDAEEKTDDDAEETGTEDKTDNDAEETEPGESTEENAETTVPMPAQTFTAVTEDIEVYVEADEGAFPEGTTMVVTPVTDDETIAAVTEAAEADETAAGVVTSVVAVDIVFLDADGNQIEPLIPIRVSMKSVIISESDEVSVVHLPGTAPAEGEDRETAEETQEPAEPVQPTAELVQPTENAESSADEIVFESNAFSVYALVGKTIQKNVLASDGHNYRISLTYGEGAGIPAGAILDVREILPETGSGSETAAVAEADTAAEPEAADPESAAGETGDVSDGETSDSTRSEYDEYVAKTLEALGEESGSFGYARFFDITILSADGEKVQPAEGSTVDVRIELADAESEELNVVHFGETGTELMDATAEGNALDFAASSFSVYAIVDAPKPFQPVNRTVQTLDELRENSGDGFLLSLSGARYATSALNGNSCFIEANNTGAASVWYFEPAGDGNLYRIYTLTGGAKQYMKNTGANLVGLEAAEEETGEETRSGTVFALSQAAEGLFYVKSAAEDKWLQHSNGGGGIRFYTDNANAGNSRFTLTYVSSLSIPDDYYELDGRTYGIAYHNDTAAAAALMPEQKNEKHLTATDMLMRPDVLTNNGILLVAADSIISDWTFHCVKENQYTISTETAEGTRYLTLSGDKLTLADEPGESAVFKVTAGSGANSGKYQFASGEYAISMDLNNQNTDRGFFGAKLNQGSSWLNLVQRSVLGDDDFYVYNARKVSVSDTLNVYDGQQVVIYTRVWNDNTKKYEFYVVTGDGSLARCYDTGDNIEWFGSQVNTALWTFTEYRNADGTLSHFYELQNTQYGNYIAPQITDGQVMSGSTIGVNLNGRRYGENFTTIIAWDSDNYAYAGLKNEDGRVAACPLAEAEDFYFAVVNPVDTEDRLTEVETLNNGDFGITMKMIDFNNDIAVFNGKDKRDSVQHAFFGGHSNNHEKGLLSTELNGEGYPVTTALTGQAGRPLSELFTGMTDVNHLFLQSIHNESGYFEYDSTQNFATLLDENGNLTDTFTVYDQLAAIGISTGTTRTHGQFMPYNSIEAGKYAHDDKGNLITNLTNALAQELADTDPRKGEKLYSIPENEADYFFGMEMSASFTQTASGLDAWGHDIIFEFSGDDDFWLYVDNELVLDLGGVRSALTGSVNFRTGEVVNAGTKTTLYETFRSNYKARGLNDGQISTKLNEIFTKNSSGQYIFRDYTNHTMKMFYMERGAGASNLRMRFNLAAVRPGTFVLSKTLSGTEEADNSLIEFPYQIWYTLQTDGGDVPHLLDAPDSVVYEGTGSGVKYAASFTPAGGTDAYEHVFFLKPGESAEITMPDEVVSYYVVECGVNPDIYDTVRANDQILDGIPTENLVSGTARMDFATAADSLENRAKVEYDNHVREGAMRTLQITKKLYDTDGTTLLQYPENDTTFTFRLYLGNENAVGSSLPAANLYPYFIKDQNDNYCRWNAETQMFESLGIESFEELTALFAEQNWTPAQQETVIFRTSLNGSIAKIPAGHTVEVRSLIIGTQYKVEERAWEMPRGYTLRVRDGYTRVDGGQSITQVNENEVSQPYTDTIRTGENPEIEVRNQKGWGLTVEKVWTDRDFMAAHDDIYFAVFVRGQLYPGSVCRLASTDTDIYYFFEDLHVGAELCSFSDFVIREVTLTGDGIKVSENGAVTGYDTVTAIEEGGTLRAGGTPVGGTHQDGYVYQVNYTVGQSTGRNENVRIDKATNSRPGVALYKTDWEGGWKDGALNGALAGAVFTLKDEHGNDVAAASYTSRNDGLITIAYLSPGVYTLAETATPKGYTAMPEALTITVGEDNSITLGTAAGDDVTLSPGAEGSGMTAVITVRNRSTEFRAVKEDAKTHEPMPEVSFALYRQVTGNDGQPRKDYLPMSGYDALVTDENGILPKISITELPAGTYYLTETQAPEGYEPLEEDLCFTIGADGTVTVQNEGYGDWLTRTPDENGNVLYELRIPNEKMGRKMVPIPATKVSFMKVDVDSGRALEGAIFTLYRIQETTVEPENSGTDTENETAQSVENTENTENQQTDETVQETETPQTAEPTQDASAEAAAESASTVTERVQTAVMTSGADGWMRSTDGIRVFELLEGEYELVETTAPDGYLPLTGPVTLTVTADGVTWKQNVFADGASQAEKQILDGEDGEEAFVVTITNAGGSDMPETGGPGTAVFYLLGAMLIMTAGAVLTIRKKHVYRDSI